MEDKRSDFGFARTVCACWECRQCCHHLPGYLIPADLEIISRHLGYNDLLTFAIENLLASPGATVMVMGNIFRVPTLVPNRRIDGACRFLTSDDRCSIHAVSPFACSRFDIHQSQSESDRRSIRGLQAIAREWAIGGLYSQIWILLDSLGLNAPSPIEARARLKQALKSQKSDDA